VPAAGTAGHGFERPFDGFRCRGLLQSHDQVHSGDPKDTKAQRKGVEFAFELQIRRLNSQCLEQQVLFPGHVAVRKSIHSETDQQGYADANKSVRGCMFLWQAQSEQIMRGKSKNGYCSNGRDSCVRGVAQPLPLGF